MIDKLLMRAIPNKRRYYVKMALLCIPITILTIIQALLIARIIDGVFLKNTSFNVILVELVFLFLIFLLKPFFNGLFEWSNRKSTTLAKQYLRKQIVSAIKKQSTQQDHEHITGHYATVACEGVESTDAYYAEFVPQLFFMSINTFIVLLMVYSLDWISALIMTITAPLIPVFMMLIGKTAEGVNQSQWQTLKRMNGHLLDLLRGMTTLHFFQRHLSQKDSVKDTSENFRKKTIKVMRLTFLSALALELTATLSTAIIAVSLGVRLLYGQLDFFAALTILLLAPEYYQPLRQLGLKFHAALNAKAVSSQLKGLYNQSSSTQESELDILSVSESLDAPVFSMTSIAFSYPNAPLILERFSLEINRGESVAIVGKSGIGKSTLLKIMIGDLKTTSGTFKLFGQDTSSLATDEFYRQIAFVSQKPKVFNGTIFENLTFGNPKASMETVNKYCRLTGFDLVLSRLENGFETYVGEGNQILSGGEAQLLSVTRACIRETQIMLLDEPTSALDPISERLIANALSKIALEKTLIIASHREETIAICNRIVEIGGAYDAD